MHQKNIFVILGCCGIPIMLYALVCLAVASYTFLTDGLVSLGLFLYALLMSLPVFLYIFTFFYMRLGKLIFKTLWLFGVLVLAVYIDYFFYYQGRGFNSIHYLCSSLYEHQYGYFLSA